MSAAVEETGIIPSIAALARVCGVARSTVQAWMRDPVFPTECDGGGYFLFDVGQWKGARDEAKRQRECIPELDDDLVPTAGVSPGLERFRNAKASLAELDLAERENKLVPIQTVEAGVIEICLSLRTCLEEIQRRFGADAHKLLDDTLREAERRIDELFGSDGEEGETDSMDEAA
jgi:hypothetical protein